MAKGDSVGGIMPQLGATGSIGRSIGGGGMKPPMMGGGMNPNMDFMQQLFGGMGKFQRGNPGAPPPNTGGFRSPEQGQPNIGPYPTKIGMSSNLLPMPPGSYPDPKWEQAPPILQTIWPQSDPTQGGTLVSNGWGKMVPRAQMEEFYRRGGMT